MTRQTIQNPLSRRYNNEVQILRLADISGTNKEEYIVHIDELPCTIQPLDDNFSEGSEGIFGRDFLMFCDVNDIKVNDLVYFNGKKYKVVGVEDFSVFDDRLTHLEIIIKEFIND